MSKKSFIDSVNVGSPCGEEWGDMKGNDRVRFCSHCAKNVNNLSEMTRKEATRLVRSSGGEICIRYSVDPRTRRPMFAEQLLQITRRTPGIAAGVMSASMTLSTVSYAQETPTTATATARTQTVALTDKKDASAAEHETSPSTARLTGTVKDPNGAVIPAAKITLLGANGARTTTTNADGVYSLEGLEPGNYEMETESPGFVVERQRVTIDENSIADSSLQVGGIEVNVDVQATAVEIMGGAMVAVEYTSELSQAIADEDMERVRDLLFHGANVNAKEDSYSKITPLFVAVEHGNVEMVRLLLNSGAKVNRRDESRQTPLMRLDSDASAELVELLVRHGAKINLIDNDGNTALLRAVTAYEAKPEVIRSLIDNGADVNLRNKEGKTALMLARDEGSIEIVRELLLAGAKVNEKDGEGETALDRVSSDDESELRDLLVSYGALSGTPPVPEEDDK